MASVTLADPVIPLLKAHSPDEREAIRRAIRLLGDDADRDAGRVDLNLIESGERIWGFFYGAVSIGFYEEPSGDIVVVQAEMLSPLRPPPRGYE